MNKSPAGNYTTDKNQQFTELEWPTWLLIMFVYSAWLLLLFNFQHMEVFIATPMLVLVLTLHSSMCHELIHGHPTDNQTVNNLIGYLPVALIYPYTIFRETHLKHHDNTYITYPGIDPESFFCSQDTWTKKNIILRGIAWVNMTLVGRLLLGPGFSFIALLKNAVRDFRYAAVNRKVMWITHYSLDVGIVYIAHTVFAIPAWMYITMSYFSLSLIQLRSFYEHQPVGKIKGRSVIQEAGWPFALLFLNNNYHHIHHQKPALSWYKLKKEYQLNKDDYLAENGNFSYSGYSQWLKFLIRPVHSPIHPFFRE